MHTKNRELEIQPSDFNRVTEKERLRALVNYGHYAPSSHNMQPWLFKITGKQITVLPNLRRKLPFADPKDRQLYLSVGAAIANLEIASKAFNLDYSIAIRSSAESGLSTIFEYSNLESSSVDYKILDTLLARHANRLRYDDTPLPPAFIEKSKNMCGNGITIDFVTETEDKIKIRKIVSDSLQEAFSNKKFTAELAPWIKPSLDKYREGMIGFNLGVPWIASFILPFMIKHFNLSSLQKKIHEDWLIHSPAYAILGVSNDEPQSWTKAGEIFENIAISAEMAGIRTGVIGAPIEIGEHYKGFQKIIYNSNRPVMLFRLGFGKPDYKFAPRLPLEKIITS